MNSALDRVKSTITISLGTKNRLRDLKGSMNYEGYINYLIRRRNIDSHNQENYIELQNIKRKKAVFSYNNYKIVYSYNEYNSSDNFHFDIAIEDVRKKGNKTSFKEMVKELNLDSNKSLLEREYIIYFNLLTAILLEIEPLFRHNGKFEDYYSWKEEFKILNLPDKSFEEDVMQKLENYQGGYHYND